MIDKSQIEHLAKLAKLDVFEDEKDKYAKQISGILDYLKKLGSVDVSGVEPVDHITGVKNITRPDEVAQVFSVEKTLAAAPKIQDQQIKVQPVFNED